MYNVLNRHVICVCIFWICYITFNIYKYNKLNYVHLSTILDLSCLHCNLLSAFVS